MFVSVADKTYEDPLDLMDEIDRLKEAKQATILAHYYVDGDLQDIADFTGDSLKLARQTTQVRSSTIVFCGVHFMAETDVAASKLCFSRICVEQENPLLTESVLEVTDVNVRVIGVHNWRVATCGSVMVSDCK